MAWIDTVMTFIVPRMATVLQAEGVAAGIQEVTLELSIYPNPASGLLHIESEDGSVIDALTAYDITGRVVLAKTGLTAVEELDLSSWSAGVYILKIESRGGTAVRRITVK